MRSRVTLIILYDSDNRVLLQHRTEDARYLPGYWALFGGSIDSGETSDDASKRELFEEIGYKPTVMYKLGFDIVPDLENLHAHAYFCPLTMPVKDLKLSEGLDLGIFSLKDISKGKLYSHKMGRSFPVL